MTLSACATMSWSSARDSRPLIADAQAGVRIHAPRRAPALARRAERPPARAGGRRRRRPRPSAGRTRREGSVRCASATPSSEAAISPHRRPAEPAGQPSPGADACAATTTKAPENPAVDGRAPSGAITSSMALATESAATGWRRAAPSAPPSTTARATAGGLWPLIAIGAAPRIAAAVPTQQLRPAGTQLRLGRGVAAARRPLRGRRACCSAVCRGAAAPVRAL